MLSSLRECSIISGKLFSHGDNNSPRWMIDFHRVGRINGNPAIGAISGIETLGMATG